MITPQQQTPKVSTGIAGLDEILRGGLPKHHLHLIEGSPGTGKTTLGLQFLIAGHQQGEPGLYVTLSETKAEIIAVAAAYNWSLEGVTILEMMTLDDELKPSNQYSMFHGSEVELTPIMQAVLEEVEKSRPSRVVFDSLSELRIIARDSIRFRRQVLALKQFFSERKITALLLEDRTQRVENEHQLQGLCHGVIALEQVNFGYGAKRRRLDIVKMRGTPFIGGLHDYSIKEMQGIVLYPRLIAAEHFAKFYNESIKSGSPGFDSLLGGGLEPGTSNMLIGAAGTGKSSIIMQYATVMATAGEKAVVFSFDETLSTLKDRSKRLGQDIGPLMESGKLDIVQIDPAEMTPGEFAHLVVCAVKIDKAKLIVIDSLNGYLHAMIDKHFLLSQLHELFNFLNQQGVLTLVVVSQEGILGQDVSAPIEVSYLADTLIYLRFFEDRGRVRKAISVVKKRSSEHEETIREFRSTARGIEIGEPLESFHGVLSGHPFYIGANIPLNVGGTK
ncbi:MAG TPA: ATPase domain-containing protein [Oligoflexus sp.]|uniref:ATPase domain-containing protein n=1 Tax=Oligoflexus sp. TaxID=1971216 RepID=UPI002D475132|nr:ATPase domain-containing protein [Oligoflexus sp.]HYX33713.1 ATPase domain-containing protein [Oligoflexus sp.]